MAGVGAGHWANLDEACGQAIEVAQRIEPDPADVAAYKKGYAEWRKTLPGAEEPAVGRGVEGVCNEGLANCGAFVGLHGWPNL